MSASLFLEHRIQMISINMMPSKKLTGKKSRKNDSGLEVLEINGKILNCHLMKILQLQKERKLLYPPWIRIMMNFITISSYKWKIRITGWIFRWYEKTKGLNKKSGEMFEEEIKKAKFKILKNVQEESFHNKKTI